MLAWVLPHLHHLRSHWPNLKLQIRAGIVLEKKDTELKIELQGVQTLATLLAWIPLFPLVGCGC